MKPELYMRDVVGHMTLCLRLKGIRAFRWRLWLGLRLMRLAAAVIGAGLCIEARKKVNGD
jgi:hypothetical protein